MREHDLKRVERELRIELPRKYREFMLAYPFSSCSWAGDLATPDDPDLLIDLNREVRELPPGIRLTDVVFIGSDGRETDYFIRLADAWSGVEAYHLGTHRVTTLAKTFDDWISQLTVANQADATAHQRTRKWWQFWK